jgi:hypothetical protein
MDRILSEFTTRTSADPGFARDLLDCEFTIELNYNLYNYLNYDLNYDFNYDSNYEVINGIFSRL